MNAHSHIVYTENGRAFFNPAPIYNQSPIIGDIVGGCVVVFVGSIAQCEAEVSVRNAGAPNLTLADILR